MYGLLVLVFCWLAMSWVELGPGPVMGMDMEMGMNPNSPG